MANDQIAQDQEPEFLPIQNKISQFFKNKFMVIAMFILGIILLFPIAIFLMSQLSGQGQAPEQNIPKKTFAPTAPHRTDQLIVKLKESYARGELERLKKKFDELGVESQEKLADSDDPSLKNYYILKFKPGTDIKKAGQELINLEELEDAEPDYYMFTQIIPADSYYGQQWGLDTIRMPQAWDLAKGSNSVTVAVIDTGIDYNHQDFSGRNIIKGPDFSTGNCCRGSVCDGPKSRDSDPVDDNGYGTHVAGTIGAITDNNEGISGVNWNVTLMAVKVVSSAGCGGTEDIVDGLIYAVDNGARVINMSLGSPFVCSQLYQDAINAAYNSGSIVVAAAGNDNRDAQNSSPASCDGVITVGNSDQNDERAPNSNWGRRVDIAAPGVEILSTFPGGVYGHRSGTSMAAPHVSGVAGLLLAANPGLPQDQVKSCLINSADPITTDENIGPRLNAYRALTLCTNTAPIPTDANVTPSPIILPTEQLTSEPLTPSPTPVKTYTCREDSRGSTARSGSIKIGSLICEPK